MELIETNLLDKMNTKVRPQDTSAASKKAKGLGLTYLGFGRYGLLNKDKKVHVTHVVKGQNLVPVGNRETDFDAKTGRLKTTVTPDKIGNEHSAWKLRYGKKFEKDTQQAKKVHNDYAIGPLEPHELHADFEEKGQQKIAKITQNNANLYKQAGVHKIKGIGNVLDAFTRDTDDVNKHLYNGKSANREEERMATWKIRSMDALFEKPEFKAAHDYTVYTGTKAAMQAGKNYLFKGFLSTSLSPSTAHDFVDSDKNTYPTIIQIDIKKGQKAIDINAVYSNLDQGKHYNPHEEEMEHLLPRGTKLKVTEGPYYMDDIQYIRAEIVSENEEDDDE